MTRWARAGPANKKKEHDATPWQKLKSKKEPLETSPNPKDDNSDNLLIANDQSLAYNREENIDDLGIANKLEESGTEKGITEEFFKTKKQKVKEKKLKKKHKDYNDLIDTKLVKKLNSLKKSSNLNDEEELEVDQAITKEKRREKRRLKRIDTKLDKKMCFNCRQSGHTMADCPNEKEQDVGTGICFKCGSTEHTVSKCRVKLPEGHYPYAKCFICGEKGHLSKQCPDNPRGLYPKGGCCKTCGSVEHYNKDCPQLQERSGIFDMKLTRISDKKITSIEEEIYDERKIQPVKKKPKIVKF